MRGEWIYPARPEAVPRARRDAIREVSGLPAAESVELVVSELVTNAVRYGASAGSEIALTVEVGPDDVRVEVTDDAAQVWAGRVVTEDELAESGRGLAIVSAISTKIGHDYREGRQSVWALIPLEDS